MPIKVPGGLPALKLLEKENIFCMTEDRAKMQDIRPLRIAVLNLMPNKEVTETQLLRMVANSPLQVEVVFLRTASYNSKHTEPVHLENFYTTFEEVIAAGQKFDGLVITGAPVEQLEFEKVAYWDELTKIMEWAKTNVHSTIYICWAAQAGLYYHYGIRKYSLESKTFGVFWHEILDRAHPMVKGFDEMFLAPHSRHTEIRKQDIDAVPGIDVIAESVEAGVYLVASKDLRHVFVTGHGEYDADSLHNEYIRDIGKGMKTDVPRHYYPQDDSKKKPILTWRAHASLMFGNWLNYCVYQVTPYDIQSIGKGIDDL